MIIDGKCIDDLKVIISPSKCTVNGEKRETNCVYVVSKDERYSFTFWTLVPLKCFNSLNLNEKVSIMDKIDSYDLDLSIDDNHYINSEENSEVYFTKIKDDVFLLNVLIKDSRLSYISNTDEHYDIFELNVTITIN